MSMMYIRILVDLHLKYYTDWHDVDEDVPTIVRLGGDRTRRTEVGITQRDMNDIRTNTYGAVASSDIRKKSLIIRIIMMSTKA